jgi:hypothetical protein
MFYDKIVTVYTLAGMNDLFLPFEVSYTGRTCITLLLDEPQPIFEDKQDSFFFTSPHAETFSSATDSGRLYVCIEDKFLL